MSLYYEGDGIQLYHGDCRVVLPALGQVADVCVTDPPYGETKLAWDRWPDGWVGAVGLALPEVTSLWCFGSLRTHLAHHREFMGWTHAQEIVWEKHNGSGFAADRFRRVHELAVHWYRGRWSDLWRQPQHTMDAARRSLRRTTSPAHTGTIGGAVYTSEEGGPRLMRSVLRVRSMHGRALHPTEKPPGILEPLIAYSCPPGGVVLDPLAGSGATLLAARNLGRRAVGVEADERYCEIAARRLEQGTLTVEAP